MTPMSQSAEPGDQLDRLRVDVDGDHGAAVHRLARRRHRQLAGVAGAEDADRARLRGEIAGVGGGGVDVVDLERGLPAAGRRGPVPTARGRRRRRCRSPRPAARPGRGAAIRSSRSGVRVSEARVTMRSPIGGGEPSALADVDATVPSRTPPESVSGLCILPRAATISRIRSPIRSGSPPHALADLAVGGRVDAETLDRDLELERPHRAGGVEALGRLGQRAARLDHPVGADPLLHLPVQIALHERSLEAITTVLARCQWPARC